MQLEANERSRHETAQRGLAWGSVWLDGYAYTKWRVRPESNREALQHSLGFVLSAKSSREPLSQETRGSDDP